MGRSLGKLVLTALGITFLIMRIVFPPHYGYSFVKRFQEPLRSNIPDLSRFKGSNAVNPEFRILICVMSPFWASWRRQIVRNAYRRFPQHLPVDVVFVEGNLALPNKNADRIKTMQHTVIEWENSTYNDILHLDCDENMNKGKTYEFLKKVGRELGHKYTHLLKTDDDAFINIPGISPFDSSDGTALVEVIREHQHEKHLYWGTSYRDVSEVTWGRVGTGNRTELWGSGYVMSWDVVEWIATSDIPPQNLHGLPEDWEVFAWLMEGGLDDNYVLNRTAFSEYPHPEFAYKEYELWNDVHPFDRWIIVTHPLKYDWMFVETAEYYLGLDWK